MELILLFPFYVKFRKVEQLLGGSLYSRAGLNNPGYAFHCLVSMFPLDRKWEEYKKKSPPPKLECHLIYINSVVQSLLLRNSFWYGLESTLSSKGTYSCQPPALLGALRWERTPAPCPSLYGPGHCPCPPAVHLLVGPLQRTLGWFPQAQHPFFTSYTQGPTWCAAREGDKTVREINPWMLSIHGILAPLKFGLVDNSEKLKGPRIKPCHWKT